MYCVITVCIIDQRRHDLTKTENFFPLSITEFILEKKRGGQTRIHFRVVQVRSPRAKVRAVQRRQRAAHPPPLRRRQHDKLLPRPQPRRGILNFLHSLF